MDEVERIAKGLTAASRRALPKIGIEWTDEGSPGPARSDVYSLWWGRDGKHKLVESPESYAHTMASCRWRWKLTPLGLRVRESLQNTQGTPNP